MKRTRNLFLLYLLTIVSLLNGCRNYEAEINNNMEMQRLEEKASCKFSQKIVVLEAELQVTKLKLDKIQRELSEQVERSIIEINSLNEIIKSQKEAIIEKDALLKALAKYLAEAEISDTNNISY